MGEAARILEQDPKGEFRDMIHDEVDKWVDQIIDVVFEDGKEPTVMELSRLFSETKQKFFGACFQALIEQKYAGLLEQEYAPCPQCCKMCKKRRENGKEMVTMQGPSALKRPWFYCVDCSYGFSPLDKVLEISRKNFGPVRLIFVSSSGELEGDGSLFEPSRVLFVSFQCCNGSQC